MNMFRRWRFVAVATALLFALVSPTTAPAAASTKLSSAALSSRILYFQRSARTTDLALTLNEISKRSAFEAGLWTTFLSAWNTANNAQKLNYSPPKGLPTKGHVFVVLGASLSKSGTITTQLKNRLKVALTALAAYPNSKVLVSGGAVKNGHSEGQVMREWLMDNHIAASRILTETKSSSTVGNAANSMAILKANAAFTSYTLISDASHIRRASVLFNVAALNLQQKAGKAWAIKQLANVAYKDKTITNPPTDATTQVIASNVAAVLGLSSSYSAVVAKPPTPALLTSLAVKPTKTTYPVGSTFSRKSLVATAVYDQGSLVVTGGVKVSGFDASKVGKGKVAVSYTDGKTTKAASFQVSVVKAGASASLTASTTTVRRNRTQVTLKVKLTSATGIVPTGKVRFYLGSTRVATVTLKDGKAQVKYPKISKTGTKSFKVAYLGNSKLTTCTKTIKLSVKK